MHVAARKADLHPKTAAQLYEPLFGRDQVFTMKPSGRGIVAGPLAIRRATEAIVELVETPMQIWAREQREKPTEHPAAIAKPTKPPLAKPKPKPASAAVAPASKTAIKAC